MGVIGVSCAIFQLSLLLHCHYYGSSSQNSQLNTKQRVKLPAKYFTSTKNIFQVSQVLPCHPPPNLSVLTQINKWIRSAWILNGFQYKFFYCLLQLIKYKAVTDLHKAVTDLYKAVMDQYKAVTVWMDIHDSVQVLY